MLPARNRMRRSEDFAATMRGGVKGVGHCVVVHADLTKDDTLVGFVVSKRVGNSVVRHRVARRMRHAVRDLMDTRHVGHAVIRALPTAAEASGTALKADIARALTRVDRKAAMT